MISEKEKSRGENTGGLTNDLLHAKNTTRKDGRQPFFTDGDRLENDRDGASNCVQNVIKMNEFSEQDFFNVLYNGEDIKTFFVSKAPNGDFHPSGNNLHHTSVKSVSITGENDEYYLPNLSHGIAAGKPGITDDTIFRCYSVFLDFDEGQPLPEKWHVQPSAIVRRADGMGCHVYFFIHPTDNIKLWRQVMKQFITHYHSDSIVSNPARWMRVPGSTRYKQKKDPERKPLKYNIIKCDNIRYSLEELAASLPVPKKEQDHSWKHETPEALLKKALETIRNAPEHERNHTLSIWAGRVFQRFPEEKWSEITQQLTDAAREVGLDSDEISKTLNSAEGYAEKKAEEDDEEKRGRPKKSKTAIELLQKYPLYRFKKQRVLVRDNQSFQIGSEGYKDFVQGEFYKASGDTLTAAQLDEVSRIHRSQAGESEEREVYIRNAAPTSDRSYIDLNDGQNTIIEVDAHGWRVSENPPVIFKRPSSMGALPFPEKNGSIEPLKEIFNLEREEDFPVIIAALAYILRGCPNSHGTYPVIVATGREGSAKSTFMKIIKKLIDPGSPQTRTPTNDLKDLFIGANNVLIYSLDNVSFVIQEMSDALCSLATGGGFARKMNYTDDEETIFDIRRVILLNGISFNIAPDLLSRSILIELRPPAVYRTETEIWETVERINASVLGGLLTMISAAMRHEQIVKDEKNQIEQDDIQTRLADFKIFSIAFERGQGWPEGMIISSLLAAQKDMLEEKASEDPSIQVIVNIVQEKGVWVGSASQLFNEINSRSCDFNARPKSAVKLGLLLKRSYKVLESQGINITQERVGGGSRRWELSTFDRKPTRGKQKIAI